MLGIYSHVCISYRMEGSRENAAGPTESLECVQGHDSGSEHQGLEFQNKNASQLETNPFT